MAGAGVGTLRNVLRGTVIGRGDAGYDEARQLYNAMIDKRPLLIARCADASDVIACVNFGRDNKLPIAIRGGGHNGPGLGSVDDGLVIDLSQMKGVRVDPKATHRPRRAGVHDREVDHATHAFGHGGPVRHHFDHRRRRSDPRRAGTAILSRQYGLAVDNLIEADVVLADGTLRHGQRDREPGSVLGPARRGRQFRRGHEFRVPAQPVRRCSTAGRSSLRSARLPAVMRWYREFQATAPEDFYIFLGLQSVPATAPFPREHWNKRMCVLLVAHNGEGGEAAVNAIRAKLAQADHRLGGPMPYPACRPCSTRSIPRACNGTGRVTS